METLLSTANGEMENIGVDRITLFFDGIMARKGVISEWCKKSRIRDRIVDKEIILVNIRKGVIDRLFRIRNGKVENPLPWTYVIFENSFAKTGNVLLCATELKGRRGLRDIPTVSPVCLDVIVVDKGLKIREKPHFEEVLKVLREYCALSMLDWVSPYVSPKTPAYLKIVQKAGEYVTATGITTPPFLTV